MAEFEIRPKNEGTYTIIADGYEHQPNVDTYVFYKGSGTDRENIASIPRNDVTFVGKKDAIKRET